MHDAQPVDAGHAGGDATGPGVVLGQPVHVVVQGVEAGGRQVPDLAHPAAQHLAESVGPADRRPVADQHTADRGTQALGEAQRHGVHVGGPRFDAHADCDGGIEQAGPVEVHGQPVFTGGYGQRTHVVDGLDVAVDGVLEAQQCGHRMVLVGFLHGGPDVVG